MGQGRFKAYSAGSHPRGTVHPMMLELLARQHCDIDGLRSKSWSEFAQSGTPAMDFIFTVCDQAAGESCPVWPGQPISAHWGFADPVAVTGDSEKQLKAFTSAEFQIANRIRLQLSLPIDKLDRLSLQAKQREIGSIT